MSQFIYQGEDKILNIDVPDLTTFSEIEFKIETDKGISKKLTTGAVFAVTSDSISVRMDAADTASVKAGPYLFQLEATDAAGKKSVARFSPNKFTIKYSTFTTQGSGKDYN